MGRVPRAKAHQHAVPFVGACGLESLVNVAGIRNASSGDFQDFVALLKSAIRSSALWIYLRDNDALLACAVYFFRRGNRQTQTRYVRALGRAVAISFNFGFGLLAWQFSKGQTDDFAPSLMQHVQLGGGARRETANDPGQFAGILDRLTIRRSDDVA
jgi:hypothetical protein